MCSLIQPLKQLFNLLWDGKSNTEVNTVEDCTLAMSGNVCLDKRHANGRLFLMVLKGLVQNGRFLPLLHVNVLKTWKVELGVEMTLNTNILHENLLLLRLTSYMCSVRQHNVPTDRWCELSQSLESLFHNTKVTSSTSTTDSMSINNPVLEWDTDLSSHNHPCYQFHRKPKDKNKGPFYILWHLKSRLQLSCSEKKKVPSAEEFLHEKVTDISSLQWHGDKSGKSYRAALHSLQYLLPVLIIRLIKPVGGGRTVTFCFSGEGEGMANWGREGREGQFLIYYITRWMNRCAFRKKERDSHQNKYGA